MKNLSFNKILIYTILFFLIMIGHSYAEPGLTSEISYMHRILISLISGYPENIERIDIKKNDFILHINGIKIYYQKGKMLSEKNLPFADRFDPIFYSYNPGPQILPSLPRPLISNRADDFLIALIGASEKEARKNCKWVPFLCHKVFVHRLCTSPLKQVEKTIIEKAKHSIIVKRFIDNIKLIYSFDRREIEGASSMSYHAFGLALDIIPRSYGRKHVYWRWSKDLVKEWWAIPISERWIPPVEVITAFEENGFVWGGKWFRFDNVHFEYRPEIIKLSLIQDIKEPAAIFYEQ